MPARIGTGSLIWLGRPSAATVVEEPPPTVGTPAVVAVGTPTTGAGGTSTTINVPVGVANGDLLIASHTAFSAGGTFNTPTGWTRIDAAEDSRIALFYRYASSEPASYAFTMAATNTKVGIMVALRDIAASSPIQAYTFNLNSSAGSVTATATGLTTTNDNTFVLMVCTAGGTKTFTGSTLTELWDTGSATNAGFGDLQATAGPSGNKTATANSSSTAFPAFLLAIKPSGGV